MNPRRARPYGLSVPVLADGAAFRSKSIGFFIDGDRANRFGSFFAGGLFLVK
jgi:hypothetical protein